MNEALRVELAEAYSENSMLKQKLETAEAAAAMWKQTSIAAENKAMNFDMEYRKNTLYCQEMIMKANIRAAMAEKKLNDLIMAIKKKEEENAAAAAAAAATKNIINIEERVEEALRAAKSPLAKLKIMATMVGIKVDKNHQQKDYRTLWKSVLMVVHEDKRRPGVSAEVDALFNCICKKVNALPKK